MKKAADFFTKEPECIYVVLWDDKYRIYVREGQAHNWVFEKGKEGKVATIKKYFPTESIGG